MNKELIFSDIFSIHNKVIEQLKLKNLLDKVLKDHKTMLDKKITEKYKWASEWDIEEQKYENGIDFVFKRKCIKT